MAELERLTITLTRELSETIKAAVNEGDYASASEVIREALRDWSFGACSGRRSPPRSRRTSTRPWRKLQPED